MRKQFIAGNWKMNLTLEEAENLSRELRDGLKVSDTVDIGVFPSFVYLDKVSDIFSESNVFVGAQNMSIEKCGAFTGEVSGPMIKDVGCTHVLIGHSERRTIYQETNSVINSKLKAALLTELSPILCVGERQEERDADKTDEVVESQLLEGLLNIASEQVNRLTIAYEPVWAIGTGKTATPEQANEMHTFIRNTMRDKYDDNTAQRLRIQYGGSVNAENAKHLLSQSEIDGALVGGASLDSSSFLDIVSIAASI